MLISTKIHLTLITIITKTEAKMIARWKNYNTIIIIKTWNLQTNTQKRWILGWCTETNKPL